MNGSAVTLDKVVIQIDANAEDASENINKLTTTLSELRTAVKGGFNSLSKLATSLNELKTASEGMDTVAENLSSVTSIKNSLQSLSEISNPKGLTKTIESLEKLPSAFDKIDGKSLENISRVSDQLSKALSPLASKLGEIASGYSAINQMADRYGVSVTKIREYTKQSTNNFADFSKSISKIGKVYSLAKTQSEKFLTSSLKHLSKFNSKIKQIGLSLLGTRTIFTATRKAVSEYMAMDADLTWKLANNWRALGAQLAPAIENIVWLFKQFVRVVYSVILALTGIDLIARANEKAMKGWGKSAKDTLGNLQKFDDLNVVEFPKSGSGADDNKLIELDAIDLTPIQKVIDWVIRLKEEIKKAWNSGEWFGVGEVLGEGITEAFKAINLDFLRKGLENIAEDFASFLNGALSKINFSIVAEKIGGLRKVLLDALYKFNETFDWSLFGEGINAFVQSYPLNELINRTNDVILSAILGIQKAIDEIDFGSLGAKLSEVAVSLFNNISTLIDNIDWKKLGEDIKNIILNIDWASVFTSIINIFQSVIEGTGGLLDGLFGTTVFSDLADDINGIISDIELMGETIVNTLGESSETGSIFKTIENIFKNVGKLAKDISDTITEWVISDEFQTVIENVESILDTILDIVNQVIEDFTTWYESEGGEKLREILDNLSELANELLPIIEDILKGLGGILKWLWDNILKPTLNFVLDDLGSLIGILTEVVKFIKHVLKGEWKAAFEDMIRMVEKIKERTERIFRAIINAILGAFELGINYIIGKINRIIGDVNRILGGGLLKKALGINLSVSTLSYVSLPRLETGTNEVPYEGVYHLHPGEAVVPKKYNPALGNGTNEETNRKLDTLIDVMNNMAFTNVVNIGNEELYRRQQRFNRRQNDIYGTDINI